jgi:alpha-beta hydrolase superfamily lysophospholipase
VLEGPFPGVVITTGSVQGSERMYWWLAQDLAERGYVVLTYDVQGQGTSTKDAIDFFLSTPSRRRTAGRRTTTSPPWAASSRNASVALRVRRRATAVR